MNDFDLDNTMEKIMNSFDRDCVILDKVFASCQQRKCFPKVEVDLDGKTF